MKSTVSLMALGAATFPGIASLVLAADQPAPASAPSIAPATMDFLASTTISGHVETAYVYNFEGSGMAGNPLHVFDTTNNGFMLNQFLLRLDKPLDAKVDWDAGYHVVLLYGQDAGVIKAPVGFSLGTGNNVDLTEAYVRVKIPAGNGIEVDAGKFVTLMGAEVIDSEGNFQYSHSYLFGFAIPFTHTGIMASYNWNDYVNTKFMVSNGWEVVADNNSSKTYMGQIVLTAPKEGIPFLRHIPAKFASLGGASLAITGEYGPEQTGDTHDNRWVVDVVGLWPINDKLTLMVNGDYGQETFTGAPHGTWWGTAGYAQYKLTDIWHLGFRGEFFSDNERFATGNTRTAIPGGVDAQEYTFTVANHTWKNLTPRLEFRYDRTSLPIFDAATKRDQFVLSADLTYVF